MKPAFKSVALVILGATLILSFLGFFSGFFLLADLASHFRLHYFIAAGFTSMVFLFYRAWVLCGVSIALLVLNSVFILPWYMGASDVSSSGGESRIKLLLSNVLGSNTAHDKVVSLIDIESPEIVVVLEVNERWINALTSLESKFPYNVKVPRAHNFGVGVYSKLPVKTASTEYFCESGIPSLVLTLEVGDEAFTLIATHPLPPTSETRFQFRNAHLKNVAATVRRTHGPIVLAGDLNTSMWSSHYQRLEAGGILVNARRGFGLEPTWPSGFSALGIPIDHVLVSQHLRVLDFKVGPNVGSDHLPVIVELALSLGDGDRATR